MIESVINSLPIQGRVLLRLLLLQYLDPSTEDIEYIAAERPDPRFVSGTRPRLSGVARETIQEVSDRIAQYRTRTRQRREQLWLQIDCLRKQITYGEALCTEAEHLLQNRFGLASDAIAALRAQARTALAKPAIRELDEQWKQGALTEEEYRKRRLAIEYQTECRKLDRERKRLTTALRDYDLASRTPLQDHEIAHIWGIPAGTLAARKAKYLHQYLEGLKTALAPRGPVPDDLWKATFTVLAARPIERSTVSYDGLDKTEMSLMEKLTAFALKTMPEDLESRAWPAIADSLFALQRLAALQAERDMDPDSLKQALLERSTPPMLESPAAQAPQEPATASVEMDYWKEHVLRSMHGEDRP